MKTSEPSILIVGGGIGGAGLECVRLARAAGLRTIVTETAERLAATPEVVDLADLAVPLDRRDIDGHIAWAAANRDVQGIVAAYCFREWAVETTAAVAEALGLPGTPWAAARRVRDKFACREWLRVRGFPQPRGRMCRDSEEAAAFCRELAGPWVVKPNNAHGSLGVTVVERIDDLPEAVAALPPENRGWFLVEEFQPGAEYSAEGVFVDGEPRVLTLTAQVPLRGTLTMEELTMPAPLPAALDRRARGVVEDGLRAAGLTFGAFHVEFWVDGETIVLGELHNRPAGAPQGMWIRMVEAVTGINMHTVVFDQILGRTPSLIGRPRAASATLLDVFAPPGVVQPGMADEVVRSDTDCLGLYLHVRQGERVGDVRQSGDVPAIVFALGDSAAGSRANAARLAKQLSLVTLPEVAA